MSSSTLIATKSQIFSMLSVSIRLHKKLQAHKRNICPKQAQISSSILSLRCRTDIIIRLHRSPGLLCSCFYADHMHTDRVMMFGLIKGDTECARVEQPESLALQRYRYHKKRAWCATSGPNQFQQAFDTRWYPLLYFSLLHQIKLYRHPLQIQSVNTLVNWGFH